MIFGRLFISWGQDGISLSLHSYHTVYDAYVFRTHCKHAPLDFNTTAKNHSSKSCSVSLGQRRTAHVLRMAFLSCANAATFWHSPHV